MVAVFIAQDAASGQVKAGLIEVAKLTRSHRLHLTQLSAGSSRFSDKIGKQLQQAKWRTKLSEANSVHVKPDWHVSAVLT